MKKICRDARTKRKVRIRKKVRGSQERPRMSVFRSSKHIYVQIVDDTTGSVLTSASSLSPEFREGSGKGSVVESAKQIGAMVAEKALAKDIRQVVFDRNGYLYHGRVKALAEGAREKGLKF
jgi:large subunit ribosomal protein L18